MKPSKDKDQKETELEELIKHCEECEKETDNYYISYGAYFYICEACYEHNFCECGNRLEDSYGSAGDGFCIRCR
jgi:ssDNA-binding Zn-finger/Zn-ribbon topoisomerase 1